MLSPKALISATLILITSGLTSISRAQSADASESEEPAQQHYVTVAGIPGKPEIADHVTAVLKKAGIEASVEGSKGFGVSVRAEEVDRAVDVLTSHLSAHSGCPIQISKEVVLHTDVSWPAARPEAPARPSHPHPPRHRPGYGNWIEAQVMFVIGGLIAALLAIICAPRASRLSLTAIDREPLRCLVVGLAGLVAMGLMNAINSALFHTVVWIPAGIALALFSGLTFTYSGLLGITFAGGLVARRFGWRIPPFFLRAALGLIAMAFLNCVPVLNLGSITMELLAFPLGIGALIVTGFGRDPGWLTKVLHARM